MSKSLYIAEKPSVAQEFAKALHLNTRREDGFLESEDAIITWCVGHLITMSYPEEYDEKLKKWSLSTLPFIPEKFKYEVIKSVKKQFKIVSGLLNRKDVTCIYVCTDSGREGEYIYRLVEQEAHVKGKERKRVWIDSQTEEEILRGIKEAKDLSEYDNLSEAAYLRAKEDYLMGINFSRLLTLKYGNTIANYLGEKYSVVSVGRVMTCVQGMVVRREREIREFVKTPFYRVLLKAVSEQEETKAELEAEWKAVEGSKYFASLLLYKENGFKEEKTAKELIADLSAEPPVEAVVEKVEKKREKKNPPLLFNLAELQNECSKIFKISPDETLKVVQDLYEKKMVTYPRTDARVLSTAVAKEIHKNLNGLRNLSIVAPFVSEIAGSGSYKQIAKTRYVNDKQITDHYAIIPTGQGLNNLNTLSKTAYGVYMTIVKRFICIFMPAAEYQKVGLTLKVKKESFFANFKVLLEPGYLKVLEYDKKEKGKEKAKGDEEKKEEDELEVQSRDASLLSMVQKLKKGMHLKVQDFFIKEGETSPPKRYNSGSMILAMENAGQLIEDEELRAQIKGSGIGTSATRAEILKKLVNNKYLSLNKKTQVITPTLLGEMIFDVVNASIKSLLNPELTASWEKGLNYVAEGTITPEEYMTKLSHFIISRTNGVIGLNNQGSLRGAFDYAAQYYKK
ncbi:MAG: type IA DNA topoisomerase [Lachnospiraceae bacterium]|nr:type IA DNA topoisomerase [Lachnospiraceae bacterium]